MRYLTSSETELLKWIGLFAMLLDHIAIIFASTGVAYLSLFRIIGRMAFIIFGFIIATNLARAEINVKKYIRRMLIWACIAQLPYQWVFYQSLYPIYELNILFQFLAVIIYIYGWRILSNAHPRDKIKGMSLTLLAVSLALFSDYHLTGFLYCLFCYTYLCVAKTTLRRALGSASLIIFVYIINRSMISDYFGTVLLPVSIAIMSFTILYMLYPNTFEFTRQLNLSRPKSGLFKYFFYIFYPFHLIVLKIIVGTLS
ncbi:TraX family protein [Aggregatibacter actinomycetemcomitans]|uniref:TraX family protein n=1 Tax=Aggregatibacter actinomycetemcomitans TaxID=714 RepID=UPI001E46468A|nr:TraX family protein [Aggregatibacter actinomycetemcomitans]